MASTMRRLPPSAAGPVNAAVDAKKKDAAYAFFSYMAQPAQSGEVEYDYWAGLEQHFARHIRAFTT
jgi:hypothetical protein